jgi:stearoyl-CoA desaturase (Delta-9 desaturase)
VIFVMLQGIVPLPWWGYIAVALLLTHVTIVCVTLYLHRYQAHRALDLHPLVAHFFRLWLWLTTGMNTREWTAVHRKHHAAVETPDDPHSPVVHGIRKVLWQGAELYRVNATRADVVEQFGFGTPEDWLERRLYTPHSTLGIGVMLAVDVLLFGAAGLSVWAVQMMWIPFFAAGVINGVAHWRGYRNFETVDASTNISPWGILIGGEELHNNHHAFGSSAKFSVKPWEFDIGWLYIRLLESCGLATVRKLAPSRPLVDRAKLTADLETLKAVAGNRLHIMADYGRMVLKRVHREELRNAPAAERSALRPLGRLLLRAEERLDERERDMLESAFASSRQLAVAYGYRQRLQQIYEQRAAGAEHLLQLLQEWCQQAEDTGIKALEEFSRTLRGYTLQGA